MDLEASFPSPQEPATGFCPQSIKFPIPYFIFKNHFNIIHTAVPMSSKCIHTIILYPDQNFVYICHLFHTCYIPHPFRRLSFDPPSTVLRRTRIMNLFIMKFCSTSYYSLPLRSKFSHMVPVLNNTVPCNF